MIKVYDVDPMMVTWIVVVVIVAILFITFGIVIVSKHAKKNKSANKDSAKSLNISDDEFFLLIGGKDNVISYKLVGSRLTLELKDYSLVNKEGLKKENFDGIIEMKNKIVLVKEDLSEELKALDSLKLD